MNKIIAIILIIIIIGITAAQGIVYTTIISNNEKIYFYEYKNEKVIGNKIKNKFNSTILQWYSKLYKDRYTNFAEDNYTTYIYEWYNENLHPSFLYELNYILRGNLTAITVYKNAKSIKDDATIKGYTNINISEFNYMSLQLEPTIENIRESINNARISYKDYKAYLDTSEFIQSEITDIKIKYDRNIYYYDEENQIYKVYPATIFIALNDIRISLSTQYIKNGIEYLPYTLTTEEFIKYKFYTENPLVYNYIKSLTDNTNLYNTNLWQFAKYENDIYDSKRGNYSNSTNSYITSYETIQQIYFGDEETVTIVNTENN